MENITLGRLERVGARSVWKTEDGDFTPWLAEEENLALLGDAIGIELELEATEQDVGPFRADILCRNTITEDWVLIENQLERTDHNHLGQLLTYAAGLKAVTIVWIANPFTEEHRAALDWLNDITDERFNFFGLELELWRIGGSAVAPKFNIASKPNDWVKTVTAQARAAGKESLTEAKRLQLEFWTGFHEFVSARQTRIRPTKPLPQMWMGIAVGRSGFGLAAVASTYNNEFDTWDKHEIRAEFVISRKNASWYFNQLRPNQGEIEAELGFTLDWYEPDDKNMCKAFIRRNADLTDHSQWTAYFEWMLDHLDPMHAAFSTRIKSLAEYDGDAAH